jgi:hypothetical protein
MTEIVEIPAWLWLLATFLAGIGFGAIVGWVRKK